jgi:hypothetical protein
VCKGWVRFPELGSQWEILEMRSEIAGDLYWSDGYWLASTTAYILHKNCDARRRMRRKNREWVKI